MQWNDTLSPQSLILFKSSVGPGLKDFIAPKLRSTSITLNPPHFNLIVEMKITEAERTKVMEIPKELADAMGLFKNRVGR